VLGAPVSTQAPQTALAFARAAVQGGHRIQRVFFFQTGPAILPRSTTR